MRRLPHAVLALAFLVTGLATCGDRTPGGGTAAVPDRDAAVRAALDTLGRLGAKDFIADSVVRHGDTVTVWTGPRVWMATDRPTTGVSLVGPLRVVAIEHVPGG
jgi:hypothetical protein